MGSRAVDALAARGYEVVVGDRRPLGRDGARDRELDVMAQDALAAACADVDAVINFVGPFYRFGDRVARAALAAGRPYVDVCDDPDVTEQLVQLAPLARAAGVPMVIGAGMSPGLTNAMAQVAAAGFEQIDEILTAWVVTGGAGGGSAPLDHFFRCISEPIPIWDGGRRATIDPFGEDSAEVFPFPDPIGDVEVRDIGHPETITLPTALESTSVRNKGAVLPAQSALAFSVLSAMGLLSDEPVEVNGASVSARHFLASFLTRPRPRTADDLGVEHTGMGARVTGRRDGQLRTRHVTFGGMVSMADATSLPAVGALDVVISGRVEPGCHGPEVLQRAGWFDAVTAVAGGTFDRILVWEGDDVSDARQHRLADLADLVIGATNT